jgi:regulatory protein YycH of two-component signal transduction system YycFG
MEKNAKSTKCKALEGVTDSNVVCYDPITKEKRYYYKRFINHYVKFNKCGQKMIKLYRQKPKSVFHHVSPTLSYDSNNEEQRKKMMILFPTLEHRRMKGNNWASSIC